MLDILSTIASPIIGIVGGALQRRHERKQYKLETARLTLQHEHEKELTALQMQAKAQETEQELALIHEQGAVDAFVKGQEAESDLSNIVYGKSKLGDFANFIRAITRPALTASLTVAVFIRSKHYKADGTTDLEAYQAMIQNPMDLAIINFAGIAIGFWFASRQSAGAKQYNDGIYKRS